MRRPKITDSSGLEIRTETEEEFLERMHEECRAYERERNSQLIAEQLIGVKPRGKKYF